MMYLCVLFVLHVSIEISEQIPHVTKPADSVDLTNLLNRVTLLEQSLSRTETELHSTMTELQATKDNLERTTSDLKATTTELQTTKAELQSTTSGLQATNTELQTVKTELQSTKSELASKTRDIAFQVYLTKTGIIKEREHHKFDGVHYNAGNGYSTTTGKFTAPISGTYIFFAQAEIYKKNTAQGSTIYIVQSGHEISSGYAATSNALFDQSTSTATVTNMRQGEEIWVESSHDVQFYATSNKETTFSGALLSAH